MYDNEAFRWRMHLFTVGVKAMAFLVYVVGMFVSKNVSYHEDESDQEGNEDKEMADMNKENGTFKNEKMSL